VCWDVAGIGRKSGQRILLRNCNKWRVGQTGRVLKDETEMDFK